MNRKQQAGVSIIELLIALSIVAILSAQIPELQFSLARNHANTSTDALQRLLQFARSHAVTNNREITVCAAEHNTCQAQWQKDQYLLVFIDINQNRQLDTDETLLRQSQLKTGAWQWRASGGRAYLRFRYDGSAAEVGSYFYCDGEDERLARQVTINRQGRNYRSRDSDGNLHHEHNTESGELSCS